MGDFIKINRKELERLIGWFAIILSTLLVGFAIMITGIDASTTVTEAMLSIIAGMSFPMFGAIYIIGLEISYFRDDYNVRKK